jgi:serine/threonine protein kinase
MLLQPGSRPVPNCSDYQLIRKLGAGAFGEVWHAHGPGGLAVALKFIRLDTQILALELRSLEVMKSVRHPNLVSLFGAWHKDNWLILAMELCDCSLQDRLAEALGQKRPGIPLDELLNYMSDAANGLDALNAKQVQHRDVKPANLLVLDSGVKVADFGLAKALEKTVASNTGAGTIAYTAPECFRGELTQQSDQYSLAVTYYYLRTGRLLFQGNQAQMMYGHLQLEPDLTHLPSAECIVLAQALSKEPSKRWPSCKAFVNELIDSRQPSSHPSQVTAQPQQNSVSALGWQPPPDVTDHIGGAYPANADFFAIPPTEIGPIISAFTTLTAKDKPLSPISRLSITISATLVCFIAFLFIIALAKVRELSWIVVWTMATPGITGVIAWAKTAFKHTCTYVGSTCLAGYEQSGPRE